MKSIIKAAIVAALAPLSITACGGRTVSAYSFDAAMAGVQETTDYTFTMEVREDGETLVVASCDVDDHVRLRCVLRSEDDLLEMLVDIPRAQGYVAGSMISDLIEAEDVDLAQIIGDIQWLELPLDEFSELGGWGTIFSSPLQSLEVLTGAVAEDGGMFERDGVAVRKWLISVASDTLPGGDTWMHSGVETIDFEVFVSEDGTLRGVRQRGHGDDAAEISLWISNIATIAPIQIPTGETVLGLDELVSVMMDYVGDAVDDTLGDTLDGIIDESVDSIVAQYAEVIARNTTAIAASQGRAPTIADLVSGVVESAPYPNEWRISSSADIAATGCVAITYTDGQDQRTWHVAIDSSGGMLLDVAPGPCLI